MCNQLYLFVSKKFVFLFSEIGGNSHTILKKTLVILRGNRGNRPPDGAGGDAAHGGGSDGRRPRRQVMRASCAASPVCSGTTKCC